MPHLFLQCCVVVILLCGLQCSAQAGQWKALNGTSRHRVAYDAQSIRLTPLGRLEILLRFVPLGETERKSAAAEYKEKRYRSHLESYEIDCQEQTAQLGPIDILGAAGERLKRLQGNSQPESILPGSVLDYAAQSICPVMDEESIEASGDTEINQEEEPDSTGDKALSNEKLQQIKNIQKKAAANEATAETWKELGNIYFDTDQPEQAINAYARALEKQPDNTDILNDQGAMYRQTGDFKQALANFEKAYLIDPHNLESLYNSAYVYAFDLNNIPKALVMWRQYLALEPKSETSKQVQSFIDRFVK